MNDNTVHLDNFPRYREAKQFLDDILPRLTACGLYLEPLQDDLCLEETKEGYAFLRGGLEVFDLNETVCFINRLVTYEDLADLAEVLEHKQVELQLNTLLPRMAAVGWRVSVDSERRSTESGTDFRKFTLVRAGSKAQDIDPTYANLDQLRKELIRTEATRWVQLHWLELEAAGCEVTLGTDVIVTQWKGDKIIYGYTLEEAKSLTNSVLSHLNTDSIV